MVFTLSVVGFCVSVASSLKMIFGKFFGDGLEGSSSRASLTVSFSDEVVMSVDFVSWRLVVVYATAGPISSLSLCRKTLASLMFFRPF